MLLGPVSAMLAPRIWAKARVYYTRITIGYIAVFDFVMPAVRNPLSVPF